MSQSCIPIGLVRHHQKDKQTLCNVLEFVKVSHVIFFLFDVLCLLQFHFRAFSCMRMLPDTWLSHKAQCGNLISVSSQTASGLQSQPPKLASGSVISRPTQKLLTFQSVFCTKLRLLNILFKLKQLTKHHEESVRCQKWLHWNKPHVHLRKFRNMPKGKEDIVCKYVKINSCSCRAFMRKLQ